MIPKLISKKGNKTIYEFTVEEVNFCSHPNCKEGKHIIISKYTREYPTEWSFHDVGANYEFDKETGILRMRWERHTEPYRSEEKWVENVEIPNPNVK